MSPNVSTHSEILSLDNRGRETGCTGLALAQGLKKAGIPCKVFDQKDSLSAGGRDWNMAHFINGTSQSGRIVIGADGAKSTVRRLILDPESSALQRIPYASTWIQARYTRDQALFLRKFHPLYIASPHPLGRFAFFGMHEAENPGPESWTFLSYISFPWTLAQQDESKGWSNRQQLDQVKEMAKEYTEPWKSAFEWLPEDHPVWHLGTNSWDPSREGHVWDTHDGRVTLAGDAAHPMTFQRGQGLNHSLTDAGKLRDALVSLGSNSLEPYGQDQASAIARYEDEMRSRGGEEVRTSLQQTRMMHDWSKQEQSLLFKIGMAKSTK